MAREPKNWRTNVGLRMTADNGAWFEQQCEKESRTYANYVEHLIIKERERIERQADEH